MMLMCSRKRADKLSIPLLLTIFLSVVFALPAQSRKSASSKKSEPKRAERQAKDARKGSRNDGGSERSAKRTVRPGKKSDVTSARERTAGRGEHETSTAKSKSERKIDDRRGALSAKDRRELARDTRGKKDPKRIAELKRIEAERRAEEAARRAAALAEKRRREEAARIERERRIAFERGLRTETADNIASDVTDGEDLDVRRAAINGLGPRAGTVVVMEAKTGKVLTIVNQNWAIRNAFKPCSTIKLVTGVAGLSEGVIGYDGRVRNSSGMILQDALARSNNGYFQRVGSNLGSRKMIEYAKTLGLGEPTGINAAGESGGRLPYGNESARIYSHGDDFEVTPLQLAVMVSALSNGGRKVVPQIPRARVERSAFRPQISEALTVPESSIEGVLPGMIGAAEYGTARRGVDAAMGVAGKTGSCITKGTWIGLFASVAPVEDPKYSVVVITRGERERGKYAAMVAGRVYRQLSEKIRRNPEMMASLRQRVAPPDTRQAAADEEGEEDSTAGDEASTASQITTARAADRTPAPAQKKMILRTTQSKPVLAPTIIEYDRSGAANSRPRIVKNK